MITDPKPLTIENVQFYKKAFLKSFAEKGNMTVDLSSITDIDLAGVQILVALIREGSAQKKEICFTGTVLLAVQAHLQLSGSGEEPCSTGEQFGAVIHAACQ